MSYREAKATAKLLKQINRKFPNRDKSSDGWIGDPAHATRDSDHNPWVKDDDGVGVVTARDFTHDPKNVDMGKVSERLRLSRDKRIKYVIFNGRMFSSYATSQYPSFTWRPYSGTNPHRTHMHLSLQPLQHLFDSIKRWRIRRRDHD